MATRTDAQQLNYHDLRERRKRQERSRQEQLQRIVELQRERHLHTFQDLVGRPVGDIRIAA